MNCEIQGCDKKARFALYQLSLIEEKKWLHIYPEHEEKIGNKNLEILNNIRRLQ